MAGRNDPCPCGSGKKYKHCCLADDRASDADPVMRPAQGAQLRQVREAAANASSWQAEVIPLAISIATEPDARPVAVLLVAGGFVLAPDIKSGVSGEADAIAAVLEEATVAAAREVGVYPATIEVRHDVVAAALRVRLEPRGIAVQVSHDLPDLQDAAQSLMRSMAGVSHWPPVCLPHSWSGWGLPRALIADLFRAAAAYWRAAPWETVGNEQAPQVRLPSGRVWTTSILGNARAEFGLVLYSDPRDLQGVLASDSREQALADTMGSVLALTFNSVRRLPKPMAREIQQAGWEMAGPDASPLLHTINTPGGGVSVEDARDLCALLKLVPRFVAAHEADLVKELETGGPCVIEWRDQQSGTTFHYDGSLGLEALEYDSPPGDDAFDHESHDGDPLRFLGELREVAQRTIELLPPDATDAEITRAVRTQMHKVQSVYNERPQVELGNLSPLQVTLLLSNDWSDPRGVIRLRRNLSFEQVDATPLFHNTRVLLECARARDGLLTTQKGNLRVDIVRELLAALHVDDMYRETVAAAKRLAEEDVWPLHTARVLAVIAGLLKKREGRFRLTRQGTDLLLHERSGELYALLFETCFRKFNIAYGCPAIGHWPQLQYQMAFTLYCLRESAPEWHASSSLLQGCVLPYARERAPRADVWVDLAEVMLERQVLSRLSEFGLAESEVVDPESWGRARYRKTPLYDQFLAFALT